MSDDPEPSRWEDDAKPCRDWNDLHDAVSRLVDADPSELSMAALLAAQGHLASLLTVVGNAIHLIPEGPKPGIGKSRCAEVFTRLGGGRWLSVATAAFLESARKDAPGTILGIDEGDLAERDRPEIQTFLLGSHDWGAIYGKFSDGDEKGKGRAPTTVGFGGPVFITFRKKPWPALQSRALVIEMSLARAARFSDAGAGVGLARIIGPAAAWLKEKCEAALKEWSTQRVYDYVRSTEFEQRLTEISKSVGRGRDKARVLLFIADLLGVHLDIEIEGYLAKEEIGSENQVVIEMIETDPLFEAALVSGGSVEVEELRRSVQKRLRSDKDYQELVPNRFSAVLQEMGFSRDQRKGPSMKRARIRGRQATVILPGLWRIQQDALGPGLPVEAYEEPEMTQVEAIAAIRLEIRNDHFGAAMDGLVRPSQFSPEVRSAFEKFKRGWLEDGTLTDAGDGTYRFKDEAFGRIDG